MMARPSSLVVTIWRVRPAFQAGSNFISEEVSVRRFDQLEGRIKLRLDERRGFMLGRLGGFEEDVAIHGHGQFGVIVLAQINAPREEIVEVAIIAARIVVKSGQRSRVRLEKRGLAGVKRADRNRPTEQVMDKGDSL